MKYTIRNRYTNEIIVEMKAKTLKEVVEQNKVNLREADLSGANLREANLSRANFQEADLIGANLSGTNLSWANLRGIDLRGTIIKDNQKEDLLKCLRVEIK